MANQVQGIQPSVLRWARESQGLSTADVAALLKREPDEIEAWETGASAPTYAQLEDLAYRCFKRPLAVFFFPDPPQEPTIKSRRPSPLISAKTAPVLAWPGQAVPLAVVTSSNCQFPRLR